MRKIKLFEEFIEYIQPKKTKKDITNRLIIIPNWKVY
jgi:hypothetical protein